MKISTLQENLKSGLLITGHIAGKNINLPILNNVLIRAEKGNIKLITTDLELGIVAAIRGKIEKEGDFTVEAKIISDYIALLPNKKVDLEKRENKLQIKSENYKTTMNGLGADEFPLIPKVEREDYFKADIDDFKQAITQVIFAVSSSETRVELSGALFCFTSNNLTIAATDSYRLAERQIKITTNTKEERKIIIPAKTLQELVRILSAWRGVPNEGGENEIQFYVSDNQILFTLPGVELISRLIEGQYPDYKQIIPTNSETKAVLNRLELIRAVKASALFSKTGINDVNLDFPAGKNKVIISSASSQAGENITELDARASGKDNSIVVNYRYLLDGLNNIEGENIKIDIANSNTPCVLRPEDDETYLYIIMPIKQ
ncbi:MAG: DNA polymerase III subunit beta [Planctomycetes bacterium]|jgi:DNA polymerase-3 subunit beta|nr:DNA polymerase III subunit beta [Planctomycetota bacterium]